MIKSPSVHSNNLSLQNIDNYLKTIDNNEKILSSYKNTIIEYLKLSCSNISISDQNYSKFVITKGIESLSHIFNTIFLYTKNLEITKHYCDKDHYYVEFISQIGEDSHSFLQLNSKDAILFVYKKQFHINNDYRKIINLQNKKQNYLIFLKRNIVSK